MACIIGIDVGGTNTDAVVVRNREVLAWTKVTTTKDVTTGVLKAIHGVLMKLKPKNLKIQQINLGTTHFVNSVVQRSLELAKVGVIRIATKPNTESVPAFFDFPKELKQILNGGYCIVSGGCDFDGSEISPINETEIVQEIEKFSKNNVRNLVLIFIFSPVKPGPEEKVYEIIRQHFGSSISCTLSHKIGQLGFVERENASILNESLKPICQTTLKNLQESLKTLNLNCPLFISQNDGTVVTLEHAIDHPVITFASGPTNSMRGAAFISGVKDAVVVDIGGTTTDVGVLIKGFPRLTGTHANVGGIRTNFRMPDTYSFGLGGGSRVRKHEDGSLTVGPDSVGYKLTKEALCFGGQVLTTTDIASFSGYLGTPKKPELTTDFVNKALNKIQAMVEEAIDSMKTSSDEIPVVLVGGGSILVKPNIKLVGSSETIRPHHAEVANAIGSALCQVSGRIDIMATIDPNVENAAEKVLEELKSSAIEAAVANSAVMSTIELVDIEFIPVSYLPGNAVRVRIVAVGDLDVQSNLSANIDWDKFPTVLSIPELLDENYENIAINPYNEGYMTASSIESPNIDRKDGIWQLTEDDVEKISIGAAILGCGGGGNPYLGKLRVLDQLHHGKTINVITVDRLLSQDQSHCSPYIVSVGYMGAPAVQTERIHSKIEVSTALKALQAYLEGKFDSYEFKTDETGVEFIRFDNLPNLNSQLKPFAAIIPAEIGGINSTEPLAIAAEIKGYCLDADLMGRAFPELQMMTSYIYGNPCVPFAMASSRGEIVIVKKCNGPKHLEDFARKVCVEFGCSAGTAESPMLLTKLKDYCILGSMTRCLKLGQAVVEARKIKVNPIEKILNIEKGKVLCYGKVTFVDRKTIGGFNRGYFILQDFIDGSKKKVDFQNENLVVWDGDKALAMVPDLIVVLDTGTGESIITDDMRYGLRATIVVLAPSEMLTTPEALKVIGPEAFGYKDLEYKPSIR